ncbi:MAG: ATP-dependent DNA helicase RecG [Candidatus Pacebacteria bacterium]|nr:ATP-dependent DNA helicase RecG [Candidatus Paceibacterota bacterium]
MLTLNSKIELLIKLRSDTKYALTKLNLYTIDDLLHHYPTRYADASSFLSISGAAEGVVATIRGAIKKIESKKSWKTKVPMSEAVVEDVSGSIKVIWFNQPYLAKMISVGQTVELTGKITMNKGAATMVNPSTKEEKALPIDSHDSLFAGEDGGVLTPLYPESKGVSSEWFSHAIARALTEITIIPDHIPEDVLKEYSLPGLKTALIWIHNPKKNSDAVKARKRFAFDEIFQINITRAQEKLRIQKEQAYSINTKNLDVENFISRFPFPLTNAQKKSIDHILEDLERDAPMSRLLEGDVGSGKTAVAATAVYATVMNRPLKPNPTSSERLRGAQQTFGSLQVAYMAPTEILATQHFESFIEYFRHTGISIALITGSGCRKFPTKVASSQTPWTTISRTQLQKWIANGEIPIVIGTHALIQKSLSFKHLALAIIDEQHRFGLNQRKNIAKKDTHFPHLLSMTATPIPRTLALTIYGDLDLSLLDEMPAGRKQIITEIVLPNKREETYEKIRSLLKEGRQAYIICPRIDEPDPDKAKAVIAKSVIEEAKRLQKDIFPEYKIGIVHSKMTKTEKENAMEDFYNHETNILVATSVIEVGVNVPNATSIIIEGAERFGLAQLHQLRGRVMRSSYQPYCYLFADAKSDKTKERMSVFTKAKNGFELAEYDLQIRGTGELSGVKQWGISDIGMEALRNIKLVEAAQRSAKDLILKDPELSKHPLLKEAVKKYDQMHFE